jgi:vitamin B12 transporter
MLKLLSLSLISLLPSLSYAADPQDLIVTVGRTPVSILKLGQAVSVLDEADIKQQQTQSVADLIAKTTNVAIVRNGGPGAAASAFVRGADNDQSLYILDGMALIDPSLVGGGTQLGLLAVEDLTRIEILRGPFSSLYGSRAIGGVISLTTAQPTKPFAAQASVEGGDGYGQQGLRVGGKGGRFSFKLSGRNVRDAGVSSFASGREKDGFDQGRIASFAGYQITDTAKLSLRLNHSHSRTQYDGFPEPEFAFADTLEFDKTDETQGGLMVETNGTSNRWRQSFSLSGLRTERKAFNPDKSPNFIARGQAQMAQYNGQYQLNALTKAVVIAGFERQALTTRAPSSFDPNPTPFKAKTDTRSLALQLQYEATQRLSLNGAVRVEDHDTYGTKTIGHGAVSYAFKPDLILRASLGQGFKAPSLFQLFSDFGNEVLSPETSTSLDGGLDIYGPDHNGLISVSLFTRETNNQIDFTACDSNCATRPFGYYNNIAKTHARGIELSFERDVSATLRLKANFSRLTAENTAKSSLNYKRNLPRRPNSLGNLDLTQTLSDRLRLSGSVRYAGQTYDDAANSLRLKAYSLVDLRANYDFSHSLEVYGRVENLLDRPYTTAFGYGFVGRRLWLGIRTKL